MNVFSNYNDFYGKPLVAISKEERHITEQGIFKNDRTSYTHWLIALIGEPKVKHSQLFHWKVAIYPATKNRQINFDLPFYISSVFESFDDAYHLTNTLEEKARQGMLSTYLNSENRKMA